MRNESTLIVRNYAQERRDPCEKFYASRLYRYLVRLRRFYRSGSADQSVADAAIVSHRHFRADQSMADAAGAIDLVVFGISSINNRRKQRE